MSIKNLFEADSFIKLPKEMVNDNLKELLEGAFKVKDCEELLKILNFFVILFANLDQEDTKLYEIVKECVLGCNILLFNEKNFGLIVNKDCKDVDIKLIKMLIDFYKEHKNMEFLEN